MNVASWSFNQYANNIAESIIIPSDRSVPFSDVPHCCSQHTVLRLRQYALSLHSLTHTHEGTRTMDNTPLTVRDMVAPSRRAHVTACRLLAPLQFGKPSVHGSSCMYLNADIACANASLPRLHRIRRHLRRSQVFLWTRLGDDLCSVAKHPLELQRHLVRSGVVGE